MKIIDPHIHLFSLERGDYHWLKAENSPSWPDKYIINRSFSVDDLDLSQPLELAGFVHIEAGFNNEKPWLEIAYLEGAIAANNTSHLAQNGSFKSIACVDLTLEPVKFRTLIAKLTSYDSVIGVRHIFDDDTVSILNHKHASENINTLISANLIFETQINGYDTQAINAFCEMSITHNDLTLILSHGCFPPDNPALQRAWRDNINKLAMQENILMKASGWEMVNRHYSLTDCKRVVDELVSAFSSSRVMLASNFPLTLFSTSYDKLWQDYESLGFDEKLLSALMHDNAKRVYKL